MGRHACDLEKPVGDKTASNAWPKAGKLFPESTGFMIAIKDQVISTSKGKGLPQQAEEAQGVPGRLRPRIFLTFGTTRVVGRQPYAPASLTPGEIPCTHF